MRKLILWVSALMTFNTFASDDVDQLRPSLYGSKKGIQCPIHIVPGKSFGALKLGMSREEVSKLGMIQKDVKGLYDSQIVGMYSVRFNDKNIVVNIEAEIGDLPDCLYFGKIRIKPTSTYQQLSKIFNNCQSQEIRLGGNIIECTSLTIKTGGWGGSQKTPAISI